MSRQRGRSAEAIELHEITLKLHETKLGLDHPDTLISRGNLASAYRAAGRTAEAIAMDEATLELRETKVGPDHPDTPDLSLLCLSSSFGCPREGRRVLPELLSCSKPAEVRSSLARRTGHPAKGWGSPQSHNDIRPDDRLPRSVRVQGRGITSAA